MKTTFYLTNTLNLTCVCVSIEDVFISFDDAKVQRKSQPTMDCDQIMIKKCVSFDVNQVLVCEHSQIVYENSVKGGLFSSAFHNRLYHIRQFHELLDGELLGTEGQIEGGG